MRALIRHAGLRIDQEQRLRLAAGMLAAHGIEGQVEPWDGTRCDLVVVNAADAYGLKVQAIAVKRGTPSLPLALGNEGHGAREDTSAGALARLLLGTLQAASRPGPPSAAETLAGQSAHACGLVILAQDGALAGKDVEASAGGRSVHLLRTSSRVLSFTHSDHIGARSRLCESGWSVRPLAAGESTSRHFEFAGSLDAFLLQGALRHPQLLPAVPEQACRLEDWPDLGTSPEAVGALRVVRTLSAQASTPSMLVRAHGLDPHYVSACLWAFAASGLLRRDGTVQPAPIAPAQASTGVMARLAAWFGLGKPG